MSEDLGAAAASALVSALIGLVPQVPWSGITDRIRGVLSRRGRPVGPDRQPELDAALSRDDAAGDGGGREQGVPEERVQSLAALLAGLRPDDRDAVLAELRSMAGSVTNQPQITLTGNQSAVHTGFGDQHNTFG